MSARQSQCPHIQLLDANLYQDGPPRDLYRELRETAPVCWMKYSKDDDKGFWAITRQEHLDYISKNPKLFSSRERGCLARDMEPEALELQRNSMIQMDPPEHLKYRRIVREAFTPASAKSYEPHLQKVAAEIVGRVLDKKECEFVTEVASELPLITICELLGIPAEDRETFFNWSNTLVADEDTEYSASEEERLQAMADLYMYADKVMEVNKAAPKDNVVGALLKGSVDGETLTQDEFRMFMLLLIVAGNETTRNQTSHMMRLLIENDQYQMLVDNPDLLDDAIEESLRYNSPVINFRRTVMEDLELGGQQLKKGDPVVMFYQSASSDEANFKDPDAFDIRRPQREKVRENLRAFGIGEHFCLGNHLARVEMRAIFTQIIARIRNPRIEGETRWLYSDFINGIKEMRLSFDVA